MSPSCIAQNGPASTRVRSSTRTPASGPLARGTASSFHDSLGEGAGDRVHAIPRVTGAAPEEPRAVERADVREVVDVVDRLDRDGRADLDAPGGGAVTDEAGAP